jgi:tRNA A-37 threonylcarbamoyl transferase component Bud32
MPQIPGHELIEELGMGGNGVVYKARQTELDREVAIKVVLNAAFVSSDVQDRFRKEAETIARLHHPNIVQVHGVGEVDGLPYYTMEHCPGGSLAGQLARGPLEPAKAAQLVRTLALAVQAAHDAQVIHRDLKPANVLLAADGTPKVADFGLARRTDEASQTVSGAVLGTPSYMAPEQARGKVRTVGPATDVYALGAILYECLTGRPPFREETALDTLVAVISRPVPSPRQLCPTVPKALEAICVRCLDKVPANRPASARQLAAQLEALLAGRPIPEMGRTRLGTLQSLGPFTRRPAILCYCALLALVLAAGFWLISSSWRGMHDGRPGNRAHAVQDHLRGKEAMGEEAATVDDVRWKEALRHRASRIARLHQQGQEALRHQASRTARLHQQGNLDIAHSAVWAWANPRATVADCALSLLVAQTGPKMVKSQRDEGAIKVEIPEGPEEVIDLAILAVTWAWASPKRTVADCAIALWVAESPVVTEPAKKREAAETLNREAWQLVTGPADQRDPARALQLSRLAIAADPSLPKYWNTLGVMQYRNGQHKEAITTLETSLAAGKGKFDAFDLFFLAMCHAKLGNAPRGKDCFNRAVKWVKTHESLSWQLATELNAFWSEAEQVLGLPSRGRKIEELADDLLFEQLPERSKQLPKRSNR